MPNIDNVSNAERLKLQTVILEVLAKQHAHHACKMFKLGASVTLSRSYFYNMCDCGEVLEVLSIRNDNIDKFVDAVKDIAKSATIIRTKFKQTGKLPIEESATDEIDKAYAWVKENLPNEKGVLLCVLGVRPEWCR
jgi:hypothetical protein